MKLQMMHFVTFRIHARNFIEPTIIHKWNQDQLNLIRQLQEGANVAVAGDMRADTPGTFKVYKKNSRCLFYSLWVFLKYYDPDVLSDVLYMIDVYNRTLSQIWQLHHYAHGNQQNSGSSTSSG